MSFIDTCYISLYYVKDKKVQRRVKFTQKPIGFSNTFFGMAYLPLEPNRLALYSHDQLVYYDIITSKKSDPPKCLWPILFLDYLPNGEMVVVEHSLLQHLERLPPPYKRIRYHG
eukprot:TRINITY_DN7634_c0_g1_i1.p1 TRINITY_DN7634_c0_g1~~TRINITY_DN7634_c0_g1_i1.p1  ORF type:complete len:114 (-),score=7.42 TRINITY_DN7634_c0_g1_i1:3-344(-)